VDQSTELPISIRVGVSSYHWKPDHWPQWATCLKSFTLCKLKNSCRFWKWVKSIAGTTNGYFFFLIYIILFVQWLYVFNCNCLKCVNFFQICVSIINDKKLVWIMVWFMVLKATFKNISVILWQSVLLVPPPTCRKSLTNCIT
jgi:hypothetical protein